MKTSFIFLPQVIVLFLSTDSLSNIQTINSILSLVSFKDHCKVLVREVIFSILGAFALYWMSVVILDILKTPVCAVLLASGLAILLFGIKRVFGVSDDTAWSTYISKNSKDIPFIAPLSMPLIVGPTWTAGVSILLTTGNSHSSNSLIIICGWALAALFTLIFHLAVPRENKKIFKAVQTIAGLFISIIGIQILLQGLQQAFL